MEVNPRVIVAALAGQNSTEFFGSKSEKLWVYSVFGHWSKKDASQSWSNQSSTIYMYCRCRILQQYFV
jgi:hypothetical protein